MQHDEMLYQCLVGSLRENFYTSDSHKHSGVMLLKVIVSESHIATKATVNRIRKLRTSLDLFMEKCYIDMTFVFLQEFTGAKETVDALSPLNSLLSHMA